MTTTSAAAKRKKVSFITPKATAVFPRLTTPDTKFKAEGEYSVKLRFAEGEFPADLLQKLEELRDEFAEERKAALIADKKGAKAKTLDVVPVLRAEEDPESGEETGNFILRAKMNASGVSKKTGRPWQRKPTIFDAKGKKLANPPMIGGGSEIKVAIEAVPYYTPKDNLVGITMYLDAVQIIKLVQGGDRSAEDYGFGEEDGYEGEANEGSQFSDESAQTSDADDGDAQSGEDF